MERLKPSSASPRPRARRAQAGALAALAGALSLATGACAEPPRPLALPDELAAAGAKSMLLVSEDPAGVTRVWAAPLDPREPVGVALHRTDALSVFLYAEPLEVLALAAGPVALPEPGAPSRPIPTGFLAAYHAAGDQPTGRAFAPLGEVSTRAALRAVRLPGVAVEACAERGGCVHLRDDEPYCLLPCREPPLPTAPSAPEPPAEPSAPASPRLLPCPEGWVEDQALEGVVTCVLPDTIGDPCPEGQWAEGYGRPGQPRLHVLSGAASGGDGSAARPYRRIADALLAAPEGAVVLVGRGLYAESLVVTSSVTIAGACVDGLLATQVQAVEARGPWLRLANLRVEGDGQLDGVVQGGGAGPVALERLLIAGTARAIVAGEGGRVSVRRTRVRDARTALVARAPGAAIAAEGLWVRGVAGTAVEVSGGGQVALAGAAVLGAGGVGFRVEGPSRLTLDRVRVQGAADAAIIAEAGAHVRLEDVVLADIAAGAGLAIGSGATLEAARTLLARVRSYGVYGSRSELSLRDLTLLDVERSPEGGGGEALVADLSELTLTRARVERAYGAGLLLFASAEAQAACGRGCPLVPTGVVEDLTVRAVRPQPEYEELGSGVEVRPKGVLTLRRALVEDVDGSALVIRNGYGDANTAQITDLTARRARLGVELTQYTYATLSRVLVESSSRDGLWFRGGDIQLEDLVVRGAGGVGLRLLSGDARLAADYGHYTLRRGRVEASQAEAISVSTQARGARPSLGAEDLHTIDAGGAGLDLSFADATLLRVRVERSAGVGVCVYGATLEAAELEVLDAGAPSAQPSGCGAAPVEGDGIRLEGYAMDQELYEARATVRGFRVARHGGSGLVAGPSSALLLHRGWVEDNGVGVRVPRDALGEQSLDDAVLFRRNGEDLRVE